MKLIQFKYDDISTSVSIASYHQIIVFKVQAFSVKHFPTHTAFLTELNMLVTKFNKSLNQQLPENDKLMFFQDTALQDLRLDIVDASNTKSLTGHQEAYQNAMDLHGHQEVCQGAMECDFLHIWNNYADCPSQQNVKQRINLMSISIQDRIALL